MASIGPLPLIPAQAGIQKVNWVPAFRGDERITDST
jgi:hypothetical protein